MNCSELIKWESIRIGDPEMVVSDMPYSWAKNTIPDRATRVSYPVPANFPTLFEQRKLFDLIYVRLICLRLCGAVWQYCHKISDHEKVNAKLRIHIELYKYNNDNDNNDKTISNMWHHALWDSIIIIIIIIIITIILTKFYMYT